MKFFYVGLMRLMRGILRVFGILGWLERRSDQRWALWLRSLFAIHDIEDMIALDLPWWSMQAMDEVDAFLRAHPGARVFEYGSGASTVWLAKRAGSVVSVEHDEHWAGEVRDRLAGHANVELRVVPPDDSYVDERYASAKRGWQSRTFRNYAHAIEDEEGKFDLIVVDGRARSACLEVARSAVMKEGMILFDNSDRRRYREAIVKSWMEVRRHAGLTACLPYPDPTTLLRPLGPR
jgi:hypothetical protein